MRGRGRGRGRGRWSRDASADVSVSVGDAVGGKVRHLEGLMGAAAPVVGVVPKARALERAVMPVQTSASA